MEPSQRRDLEQDFAEWSGGFAPESTHAITAYLDYAMPADYDWDAARQVLYDWMNSAERPSDGGDMLGS